MRYINTVYYWRSVAALFVLSRQQGPPSRITIIMIIILLAIRSLVALNLWARFARRKVADGLASLAGRWPMGSLRSPEGGRWARQD